ncbi:unnamed protein product [Spirodela intermedia]|uniref:Uncharacterized protein n=1 Tax=Spirodela intermedia TaxID=51605 RepID=A0A7I8IQI3_SPIIN|nr:unnamed protein product [Spirodela intermedia]CAA6660238.1 unnamed protein product [Spirodela intermedia]
MAPIRFKNSPVGSDPRAPRCPGRSDPRPRDHAGHRRRDACLGAASLHASPHDAAGEGEGHGAQVFARAGAGAAGRPDALKVVCLEEVDGKKWKYVAVEEGSGKLRRGTSVKAISLQHSPMAPVDELVSFIRSYVVPEGFPHSYFFGGAMSVFTTQTLLSSVGVSRNTAASGAVAINWILKDGAGRVGKMLFARQGKKFDYDLKQLRFAGDLLMELGAGVELVTAAVPHLFLPLACAANVAKNVAAVTSTSTRTPIYKAFAKGENIGDVTAKGECVANVADLHLDLKRKPSLVVTFALLSCGYVFSSYQEVKSVVLSTLNRARFTVAVESSLKLVSHVPSLAEGNSKEHIFDPPWCKNTPVVLGTLKIRRSLPGPDSFLRIKPLFEEERYIITYNPGKNKVYALLKDQAESDDILKAAFHLHCDPDAQIVESCEIVSTLYENFKGKAAEQGWVMSESLLNPGRARLLIRQKGE